MEQYISAILGEFMTGVYLPEIRLTDVVEAGRKRI